MNLPHTTPEQRSPLYSDVEDLIQVGFLTHPVTVGGVQLSLRSLVPGDLHLLRSRAVKDSTWREWFLASSIWMVDGFSLLEEPHAAPRVYRTLKKLPSSSLSVLFSLAMGMFNRSSKALLRVEAYCYESQSRYLWRTYGRERPTRQSGIPGAERLGINPVQGMWILFNQSEDERHQQEAMWEGSKLVASAMSPKGVSKLDQRDKQRRADENARRQWVMDRLYYSSKGMISADGQFRGNGYTEMYSAHTAEELEEEMRRWVAGEEDWHDRIVSNYKKQITDRIEQQKLERQARYEALQQEAELRAQEDFAPLPLVAYTPNQLAAILRDRNPGPPGMRTVYPDGDPRQQLYDRYLAKQPGAPQPLVASEDGGISPLAAAVAQRKVPFQTRREG